MRLKNDIKPGIAFGDDAWHLLNIAKQQSFAYPAVNVVGSQSIIAALQAAKQCQSPIIIQISQGGAAFFLGKHLTLDNHQSEVQGAVAAAKFIHHVARFYEIPVILHTDHAPKKSLAWIDGLLEENQQHLQSTGHPLFSSHMLDLSQETIQDNLKISVEYFKKLSAMNILLEIELGCTGGEEDGVDNTGLAHNALYTHPEDVLKAYQTLNTIDSKFTIAASFGNVHGVYKPGNVKLNPKILRHSQTLIQQQLKTSVNPVHFVFHGGSGSSRTDIQEAIEYGVVKMNIDTDTQWASWQGVKDYYEQNRDYLQAQLGNPDGPDKPNKKYYDPRVWLKKSEDAMTERLVTAFSDLNCLNRYA